LSDIFIPIFTGHCVLAFIQKTKEQKYFIISSYVLGFGLLSFFLINPESFLVASVPKMYFPNYYVAGNYYFLMLILFFFLIGYVFVIMARTYVVSDFVNKNRIKYFALALFLGYSVGSINFLLIYNVLVDPMWGIFFIPLFSIPFTYAIVHYELMDIKIIAKKAFIYVSVSVIISFALISLNYLNSLIIKSTTKFPVWGSSFVLSFIATVVLIFLWKKLRETDFLKYEFINIITHKFRTPLTAIKWASDNLNESIPENLKEDVYTIQESSKSLVELTNVLTRLATTDNNIFGYVFKKLI
jgi:signal transduction histidine kinase